MPVVRSAEVHATFRSSTSCDVTMRLTLDGADVVDHRLDAQSVERLDIKGAQPVGSVMPIGRTHSLKLRPEDSVYQIQYRAEVAAGHASRCPIWLPTVPTDGLARTVKLVVDLPVGSMAADSMPALDWTGSHGETILGHLPAFVRVDYAAPGATPSWGISRTMDVVTIAVIVFASAIWAWKRKR